MENTSPDFDNEKKEIHRKVFNVISHDLKTPLACIIGSLEIIEHSKEKLSTQQIDTLIKTAISEAHRLNDFISEMLEKNKPN